MLKKEFMTHPSGGESFTFTIFEAGTDYPPSSQGYGFYATGSNPSKIPYWEFGWYRYKLERLKDGTNSGSRVELTPVEHIDPGARQTLKVSSDGITINYSLSVIPNINFVYGTSSESLGLKEKYLRGIRQASVTFDPPLQGIYKKVKQVFTRSRKEGVVNAWEGTFTGFWRRYKPNIDRGCSTRCGQYGYGLYRKGIQEYGCSCRSEDRRTRRRHSYSLSCRAEIPLLSAKSVRVSDRERSECVLGGESNKSDSDTWHQELHNYRLGKGRCLRYCLVRPLGPLSRSCKEALYVQ